MGFLNLVGREFLFYGVDNHMFKLDDTVWEAVEDPSDGYRSYLSSVVHIDNDGIFFREPIAIVRLEKEESSQQGYCNEFSGFKLVDVDNLHKWLVFGTDNTDDYYPMFCFNYTPRPPGQPPKIITKNLGFPDPFDRFFEPRES